MPSATSPAMIAASPSVVASSTLEPTSAHLLVLRRTVPLWCSEMRGTAHFLPPGLVGSAPEIMLLRRYATHGPSSLLPASLIRAALEVMPLHWAPTVYLHRTTTLHAGTVPASGKRLSPRKPSSIGKVVWSTPRIPETLLHSA